MSHDSTLYGAQRSLADAVVGLRNRGHTVDVCVPGPGPLVELLTATGVPVRIVGFGRWILSAGYVDPDAEHWVFGLRKGVSLARREILSATFDVVYTNTVTVLDFAIAAKLCGVPHVWHIREAASDNPQLISTFSNSWTGRIVRGLSNRVIFNSNYLRARYGKGHPTKDLVVYNGTTTSRETSCADAAETKLPLTILTAGFMERRKGLDVLLDALLAMPLDLRKSFSVVVAGQIEERYLVEEITPRVEKLADIVRLLGWVDNMQECMRSANLLVSSARDEPFGRTLIEAMVMGIPVVATRSGGPEEIVEDGVTGLLVPSDDPQSLADALIKVLKNTSCLDEFRKAGLARAKERFTLDAYVDGIERCMKEVITT